jgi:K+-sensing histidine kinase KdpD
MGKNIGALPVRGECTPPAERTHLAKQFGGPRRAGIPSDDLPHIFEEYYQAGNVAATIPCAGIGLANVRHLIEGHGGTVSIDSTEGEGTVVTVRLPLLQADDKQADAIR